VCEDAKFEKSIELGFDKLRQGGPINEFLSGVQTPAQEPQFCAASSGEFY
jgi:hypothetical protein